MSFHPASLNSYFGRVRRNSETVKPGAYENKKEKDMKSSNILMMAMLMIGMGDNLWAKHKHHDKNQLVNNAKNSANITFYDKDKKQIESMGVLGGGNQKMDIPGNTEYLTAEFVIDDPNNHNSGHHYIHIKAFDHIPLDSSKSHVFTDNELGNQFYIDVN